MVENPCQKVFDEKYFLTGVFVPHMTNELLPVHKKANAKSAKLTKSEVSRLGRFFLIS